MHWRSRGHAGQRCPTHLHRQYGHRLVQRCFDSLRERHRRGKASLRRLGHGALNDAVEPLKRRCHVRCSLRQSGHWVLHVRGVQISGLPTLERWKTGQGSEEQRPKCVNVALLRKTTGEAFRCEEFNGISARTSMVHIEMGNIPEQAKVGHKHVPTFKQENIAQLEIAVYDAEAVRVGEGATELSEEWTDIRRAKVVATLEPIAQ